MSIDDWLDLFFAELIETNMPRDVILFVYDFKASQASLAKIRDNKYAERFEVYINGIELANGFSELTCPKEQLERFQLQNTEREHKNLHVPAIDHKFLEALSHMPESSGVALGIDRLIMLILKKDNIKEVQTFSKDDL